MWFMVLVILLVVDGDGSFSRLGVAPVGTVAGMGWLFNDAIGLQVDHTGNNRQWAIMHNPLTKHFHKCVRILSQIFKIINKQAVIFR
jgi:hypothetical protein